MGIKDNTPRLLLLWILILISLGSIFIHESGKLFYGLPTTIVVIYCSIVIHYVLSSSDANVKFYLVLIVTVALYRTIFIALFTKSLIGFDPDTYALSVQALIKSGSTQGFNNNFYESIPGFHILIGTSHLVTDLPVSSAMIIFPMIASIVFISSVYIITLRFIRNKNVAITAAILVSSSATLIRFSNLPIPQLHTALLVSIFIFTLILLSDSRTRETVILILLCLVSITFTHKIGLYVTSGGLLATGLIQYFHSEVERILKPVYKRSWVILCGIVLVTSLWLLISIKLSYILSMAGVGILIVAILKLFYSQLKPQSMFSERSGHLLFGLLTISVIFVTVQWTYLTSYLNAVIVYRILPTLTAKGETILSQQSSFSHAEAADPGLLNAFFHQSHSLLILLSATLGLLILLHRSGIYNDFAPIVGFYTFIGHLVPLGLMSGLYGGIGIQRTALMLLPISFPLSAYILNPQKRQELVKFFTLLILITMIIFQVFSVVATPDYPNSYRSYLDSEEVQQKSFNYEHIHGTIHTDYFYSTEAVNILPSTQSYARGFDGKYESIGLTLLRGRIAESDYSYISLRTDTEVYRTEVRGGWVLTYDPHAEISVKYNSIYDNGGVITYEKR